MARGIRALAVATVSAVVVCSAASAAGSKWESFVDQKYGIRVSIPTAWCIVPPSVAQIEVLIPRIERQKNVPAALATTYEAFIPSVRKNTYVFQAFECPLTPWPDPTDFAVAVARTAKPYTADDLFHSAFAKSFAAQGMTVESSAVVSLGAGQALLVRADQQETTQISARVVVYTFPHGTLLVSLSFRTDARDLNALATFTAIADRFAFVRP